MIATPIVTYHHNRDCVPLFALLASDGLWDRFSSQEAVNVTLTHLERSVAGVAKVLVDRAVQEGRSKQDNTTVLFVPLCQVLPPTGQVRSALPKFPAVSARSAGFLHREELAAGVTPYAPDFERALGNANYSRLVQWLNERLREGWDNEDALAFLDQLVLTWANQGKKKGSHIDLEALIRDTLSAIPKKGRVVSVPSPALEPSAYEAFDAAIGPANVQKNVEFLVLAAKANHWNETGMVDFQRRLVNSWRIQGEPPASRIQLDDLMQRVLRAMQREPEHA